jgi:hypothetical protein
MDKQLIGSYYLDLKTLITSAFLGVVSFQIIAPTGWDYLYRYLRIDLNAAYLIFILLYFIVVPLGFLFWFRYFQNTIKIILPPFIGEKALDKNAALFLRIIQGSLIILVLAHILISFFDLPVSSWLLSIFICFCALATVLIILSFSFGKKLIFASGLQQNKDWQTVYRKSKILSITAYVFIALFGLYYCYITPKIISQEPVTKIFKDELKYSFELIREKRRLDTLQNRIDNLNRQNVAMEAISKIREENILVVACPDSINFAKILQNFIIDDGLKLYQLLSIYNYKKNAYGYNLQVESADKDKSTDSLIRRDSVLLNRIVLQNNRIKAGMNQIDKRYDVSLDEQGFRCDTNTTKLGLLSATIIGESNLEIQTLAQKFFGPHLRNIQSWGVPFFLFLLMIMLSLHQYLKLNLEIANWQYKALEFAKKKNQNIPEELIASKEKTVLELQEPSKNLWLIITIGIWLLIPLIKPIADTDINIESPFKGFTLFQKGVPGITQTDEDKEKPNRDKKTSILSRIDSIIVKNETTYQLPDSLFERLKTIEEKANRANEQLENIY